MYNKHLWGYFALLEQDSDANIYFMIESAERVLICWFSSSARQKKKKVDQPISFCLSLKAVVPRWTRLLFGQINTCGKKCLNNGQPKPYPFLGCTLYIAIYKHYKIVCGCKRAKRENLLWNQDKAPVYMYNITSHYCPQVCLWLRHKRIDRTNAWELSGGGAK